MTYNTTDEIYTIETTTTALDLDPNVWPTYLTHDDVDFMRGTARRNDAGAVLCYHYLPIDDDLPLLLTVWNAATAA